MPPTDPLEQSVTRSPRPRRRRGDAGAAAVEMALVLPLLLVFLFGIIDFGLMLKAQISLSSAAREGARAQVFGQNAQTRVQQATTDLDGTVTATVTPCTNGQVTVVTTYTYTFITPLAVVAPLLGGSVDDGVTLTGKGVMTCAS